MKVAKKASFNMSAEVIDFETGRKLIEQRRTPEKESKIKACFQTEQRYSCKDTECPHISECKKLIAIWMR